MRIDKFFSFTGRPFSYYPELVHRFNISVNACVLLCHVGWRSYEDEPEKWGDYSVPGIQWATGLSEKEQATARKQLSDKGLIEHRYARLEHCLKMRLGEAEIPDEDAEGASAESAVGHPPEQGGHPPNRRLANPPNGVSTKGKELKKEGGHPPLPREAECWNALKGVRKVSVMTASRLKALLSRKADPHFAENWVEAMGRIERSSFCTGGNDRGWRADFDFFLRPDTVAKVMEGKYDNADARVAVRPMMSMNGRGNF